MGTRAPYILARLTSPLALAIEAHPGSKVSLDDHGGLDAQAETKRLLLPI